MYYVNQEFSIECMKEIKTSIIITFAEKFFRLKIPNIDIQ